MEVLVFSAGWSLVLLVSGVKGSPDLVGSERGSVKACDVFGLRLVALLLFFGMWCIVCFGVVV